MERDDVDLRFGIQRDAVKFFVNLGLVISVNS